ncbi:MAG: alpha/beta hydrolase, partial [Clostridiales bacterium]|nr:alpha/beta hydrolase [Clostridiales bacterium]
MENKTAIILIHGYMGSPRQFDGIRKELGDFEGDIYCLTLPGHEKDASEFIKTDRFQWQQYTEDFIDGLRGEYERLILVGHSMGGLIAVQAAINKAEKIVGVIAIGFPIKVTVRRAWIKNGLLASRPCRENESELVKAARSMSGVKMSRPTDYVRTLPCSSQFLRLARLSRKELSRLSVPLTVINFENDEIVSKGTKLFVEKSLPSAKILMLHGSYHFLFTADEVGLMANEIKAMAGS